MLESDPDIAQRDLAIWSGVSHATDNYCWNVLIEKGLVKLGNFQESRHKFGWAYLFTPLGVAAKTARTGEFLRREMVEFGTLKAEIESPSSALRETGVQSARSATTSPQSPPQTQSSRARPGKPA